MSTRSIIAVEQTDGGVLAVRCHFDGYPNGPVGVGSKLHLHFNTVAAANALAQMGGMSMLGTEIGGKVGLDEDGRPVHEGHDQCVFYHRDWEQDELEIHSYETVADFCGAGRVDFKFAYLFRVNRERPERSQWVFSHCAWGRMVPAEPRVLTDWDMQTQPEDVRMHLSTPACIQCGATRNVTGGSLPLYDQWRRICDDCFNIIYPRPFDQPGEYGSQARW